MRASRIFSGILSVAASIGLAVACGGTGGGGSGIFGTGGGGGSANGGNTGGYGAFGTGGGGNFGGLGGGSGGGLNPDAACANLQASADRIPVAMYIMLDKSGSMGSTQYNPTKWQYATQGITQFVNDKASAGIKVALQYFPGSGSCNGTGYNTPAVPLAALPGNASAITSSLSSTSPGGLTPTEGALRGLTQFCKSYEQSHPQEKCVGLLVTDGDPTQCTTGTNSLANIAASAYSGSPSVLTFTMGMPGATTSFLNAVAAAGGTKTAFDASSPAKFVAALQNIAGQILSCDFQMPTTDAGTVNPDSIIMSFTSGSGQKQSLKYVKDQSACTAAGGFYYDNPTNPTKITLCPSTCTTVQNDKNGKIQILLDCTKLGPA